MTSTATHDDTGQLWIRAREDDGQVIPGSIQTATLFPNRVEFEDGTVSAGCPWNPSLPLDAFLYSIDYQPMTESAATREP